MLSDESFGEHLAALVRRQGLRMADFARTVKVSASTLSRIRTGKRRPSPAQLKRWADALRLDDTARAAFVELALLEQAPTEIRQRLRRSEDQAAHASARQSRIEQDYGKYRGDQGFHDGWWLTYSFSFQDDDRVQRSLLHLAGGAATLEVRDPGGALRYSYHGACEPLGDKLFIRVAEDRGGAEYVQITLHSLFDYQHPSFLYGLVNGISGKDIRHPLSCPSAARMLLLHVGDDAQCTEGSERLTRLRSVLGTFELAALRSVWPAFLGEPDYLRQCLRLDDEPLERVVLRMINNRLGDGEQVLRAVLR